MRRTLSPETKPGPSPVKHTGASLSPPPLQRKKNNTGLPDDLKSGIENLSGMDMGDVKVHYNSSQPAQLHAHAYAQGNQIHVAPGQEKHLPHEAWHVVQQKQGSVSATRQLKGSININDDASLEREADVMGVRALQRVSADSHNIKKQSIGRPIAQRVIKGLEDFTIPGNIPNGWVDAYITDLAHHHSHLNEQDLRIIYKGIAGDENFPGGVQLVNKGGEHWDVTVTAPGQAPVEYRTRHDGNCAIHCASLINRLKKKEAVNPMIEYTASDKEVQDARTAIQGHYKANVQPIHIKGIIAGAIRDKNELPESGFGPALTQVIEHSGYLDASDQQAALARFAPPMRQQQQQPPGGNRGGGAAAAAAAAHDDHEEKFPHDKEKENALLKIRMQGMVTYLRKLEERLQTLPVLNLPQMGALLSHAFKLMRLNDDATRVSALMKVTGKEGMDEVLSYDVQFQLAAVITHVLEALLNSEQRAYSSKAAVYTYAHELTDAFGLLHSVAPRLGKHLPPTTIAAAVTKNAQNKSQVFLGMNAGQGPEALAYRHQFLRRHAATKGLLSLQQDVRDRTLDSGFTDSGRDEFNCAECVPVARAMQSGAKVQTDDVFPLSRHSGNEYTDIKTCPNCQHMYGLEDRSERERKRQAAQQAAAKAARDAEIEKQKKAAKDAHKDVKDKSIDMGKLKQDIQRLLKVMNFKGDMHKLMTDKFPLALWATMWVGKTDEEKMALINSKLPPPAPGGKSNKKGPGR
jgi:hypothetical protein